VHTASNSLPSTGSGDCDASRSCDSVLSALSLSFSGVTVRNTPSRSHSVSVLSSLSLDYKICMLQWSQPRSVIFPLITSRKSPTEPDVGTPSAWPTLHSWPAVSRAKLRAMFRWVRGLLDSALCMSSTMPITGELSMLIMLKLCFENMTTELRYQILTTELFAFPCCVNSLESQHMFSKIGLFSSKIISLVEKEFYNVLPPVLQRRFGRGSSW